MNDVYDLVAALPAEFEAAVAEVRRPMTLGDVMARTRSRSALRRRRAGGSLQHLHRNLYLPGGDPPGFVERLYAVRRLLPDGAVVSHHTAAMLHGFGVVTDERLHVSVPPGRVPRIKGVVTHLSALPGPGPVPVCGLPCSPPLRTATDLARLCARPDALVVLDAALRTRAFNAAELAAEVDRLAGHRGVVTLRQVAGVADGRAERRQESHLRLLLVDGGLPPPQVQVPVRDAGGVGRHRVDLAYEALRIGLEYGPDRSRHNWLAGQGWTMRYFTDDDLYRDPHRTVETVRAALHAARLRSSPPAR